MKSKLMILPSILMTLTLLVAGGTPAVADPDKDEAHGKEYRERREDRKYREGRDDREYRERRDDREYREGRDDRKHYEGRGDRGYREGRDDREYYERQDDRRYREGRSYFHQHGYTHLDIPPGHLPPPGACRVWYPGQPPGHQPPPGPCGRLRHRVPAGAWLIQRPVDTPAYVDIEAYDTSRPGIVLDIGVFAVDTGAFIRIRPR
jgi:hypothetical protein